MFKKRCKKCDSRISKKFQFCPNCGFPINENSNQRDYGILGKSDNPELNELLGGFGMGKGILNKMIGGVVKMIEKEMQNELGNLNKEEIESEFQGKPKTNFQLYVNGKKINIGETPQPKLKTTLKKPVKTNSNLPTPSPKMIKSSKNLPREEAETVLKRLPEKVIYELEAQGVKELDQILVNHLEEGIEIKMFTKKKVLYKKLKISLPLIAYYLRKQKLFLEFKTK